MLQLKTLYLEGFGTIENTLTVNFNQGINILNAENGKGKTTIGKAIDMLLYNNYETGSSYADYINWNRDNFTISLQFNIDDVPYKLSLGCKKNKTACVTDRKLLDGITDKELATGEDVIVRMASLLDPVSMYGFFVKQKSVDNITSVSDSARREMFKKIFEYDFNREIKSIIEPHIDELKKSIIQIDKEIYSIENIKYEPDVEKPLSMSVEDFANKTLELESIEKDITAYQAKKELYDNKEKEYSNKKNRLEQLRNSKIETENKIVELQSLIDNLKNKDIHTEYTNKINKLKEEFNNYQLTSLNSIESNKKELVSNLEIWNSIEKESTDTLATIKLVKIVPYNDTELKSLISSCATIEAKIKELQKVIDLNVYSTTESQKFNQELVIAQSDEKKILVDIDLLSTGVCPTCGNDCTHNIEEYQSRSVELHTKIDTLIATIKSIESIQKGLIETELNHNQSLYIETKKAIEEQNAKKKEIEDKIKKNDENKELKEELNTKLSTCTIEKERLQSKFDSDSQRILQSIKAKEDQLQQSIDSLSVQESKDIKNNTDQINREELSITEKKATISMYDDEIDVIIKENTEIESWLEKNKVNDVIDDIKYNELRNQLSTYNRTIIENEQIRKNNELLVKKQNENLIVLAEKKKVKEQLVQDQYNYEQSKVILQNEFPNFAIDQGIQDVENEMNNFIELVYPKSLNVILRSTKTTIKLEYGTGKVMKDASMLSGAESKIVQMAFTNIFNRKLNLQCLMLDEPDAALDDTNKLELYSTLIEMKDLYSQMILTTHSKKMKDYLLTSCGEEVTLITL